MENLIDRKPKWADISEFELPEAAGVASFDDYLEAVRKRLVGCISYLAQVVQFMPDIESDVLRMENNIYRLTKKREGVINWYLANPEKINNMHRRSKDLMVAYIEKNIAEKSIKEIDDSIKKISDDIIDKKHELIELQYRRDLLKGVIDSCICIINSLTGKRDGR